jgi:hypothetical protein
VVGQKKISHFPIRHAAVGMLDVPTISVVTYTGNELMLSGFSFNFEELWQCKMDAIKAVARDKQPRTMIITKLDDLLPASSISQKTTVGKGLNPYGLIKWLLI